MISAKKGTRQTGTDRRTTGNGNPNQKRVEEANKMKLDII